MSPYRAALDELSAVVDRIDDKAVDGACDMIAAARHITLYACGREGLQLRGFCMRLFHMGLEVAMVGDVTTPAIGAGDLFIDCAGPGFVSTSEPLMNIARNAGARVLFITARPDAPLARLADFTLLVPAQTMADDQSSGASRVLPMGSAMEGALFILFEVMIYKLKERLGVTAEAMRGRHTNME